MKKILEKNRIKTLKKELGENVLNIRLKKILTKLLAMGCLGILVLAFIVNSVGLNSGEIKPLLAGLIFFFTTITIGITDLLWGQDERYSEIGDWIIASESRFILLVFAGLTVYLTHPEITAGKIILPVEDLFIFFSGFLLISHVLFNFYHLLIITINEK